MTGVTCYKCNKPAVKQTKRADGYSPGFYGGDPWRNFCLKHYAEQITKYPLEVRDIMSGRVMRKV